MFTTQYDHQGLPYQSLPGAHDAGLPDAVCRVGEMRGGWGGSSSVLLQEAVDVESSHRMESSCTASESPIQTSFTDASDSQVPTPVSDMNLKSGWGGGVTGG